MYRIYAASKTHNFRVKNVFLRPKKNLAVSLAHRQIQNAALITYLGTENATQPYHCRNTATPLKKRMASASQTYRSTKNAWFPLEERIHALITLHRRICGSLLQPKRLTSASQIFTLSPTTTLLHHSRITVSITLVFHKNQQDILASTRVLCACYKMVFFCSSLSPSFRPFNKKYV